MVVPFPKIFAEPIMNTKNPTLNNFETSSQIIWYLVRNHAGIGGQVRFGEASLGLRGDLNP